jgi:phosphoribosylamine--glycine ligase
MGAVSPVPFADDVFMQKVITKIIEPTVSGFDKDGWTIKALSFLV